VRWKSIPAHFFICSPRIIAASLLVPKLSVSAPGFVRASGATRQLRSAPPFPGARSRGHSSENLGGAQRGRPPKPAIVAAPMRRARGGSPRCGTQAAAPACAGALLRFGAPSPRAAGSRLRLRARSSRLRRCFATLRYAPPLSGTARLPPGAARFARFPRSVTPGGGRLAACGRLAGGAFRPRPGLRGFPLAVKAKPRRRVLRRP